MRQELAPLLISPEQAAAEMGITLDHVYHLIQTGQLPAIQIGTGGRDRVIRIRVEERGKFPSLAKTLPPPLFLTPAHVAVMQPEASDWPEIPLPAKDRPAVYVLQMDVYYKIGKSTRPKLRVAGHTGFLPVRPRLIALMETDAYAELEYHLHCRFTELRTNGEWFRLRDSDVRFLLALAERMAAHPIKRDDARGCWRLKGVAKQPYRTFREAYAALVLGLV